MDDNEGLRSGFVPDEARRFARELGKHKLLQLIQNELMIDSNDSDTSTGSTVTKSALIGMITEICIRNALPIFGTKTKKSCIETLLYLVGGIDDSDDVSNGGTVTSYALLKILLGIRNLKSN